MQLAHSVYSFLSNIFFFTKFRFHKNSYVSPGVKVSSFTPVVTFFNWNPPETPQSDIFVNVFLTYPNMTHRTAPDFVERHWTNLFGYLSPKSYYFLKIIYPTFLSLGRTTTKMKIHFHPIILFCFLRGNTLFTFHRAFRNFRPPSPYIHKSIRAPIFVHTVGKRAQGQLACQRSNMVPKSIGVCIAFHFRLRGVLNFQYYRIGNKFSLWLLRRMFYLLIDRCWQSHSLPLDYFGGHIWICRHHIWLLGINTHLFIYFVGLSTVVLFVVAVFLRSRQDIWCAYITPIFNLPLSRIIFLKLRALPGVSNLCV